MNPAETIGALVAVATLVGGLAAWGMRLSIRSTVSPLQTVIENNTRVMERIEGRLDEHADTLVNHGNRIVRIETVQELEANR